MSEENVPSFGKYQVVKRLDKGAMGEVFMAYQPLLERRVAIKVLHPHLAGGEDFVDRFKREAAVVARLRHTNIMQVYDFDVADDRYFMVMEFLDGPTLKAEMQERTRDGKGFTLYELSYIVTALASALDYAHVRGMIHRDIKPANIMFNDEGQIVLTDFGIVHIVGDVGSQTQAGQIIGTPAYMSPEQGAGRVVGAASDIYSLGVVLYQLLAGQLPFQADSAISMVMKHVNEPVPPLSRLKPDVPSAVEAAIMNALHKDPEKRYSRAGNLARALRQAIGMTAEQALAAFSISAVPDTPPPFSRQVGTATDDDVTMISQSVSGATEVVTGPGPYRGLFAFREVDARFFFGREAFTDQLVERSGTQPLTAVVGPSGSGKSSVVFAGLVAALRAQGTWIIDSFRPGGRPFEALAGTVVPLLWPDLAVEKHPAATEKLAGQLRRREVRFHEIVDRLDRMNPNQRVLFVIDQFEELFTLCTDVSLRHHFLDEILDVVDIQKFLSDQRFSLVLTLRADFLGQALAYRPLADALQGADVKLGPMSRDDLSRAIANPARRVGVEFESGLVLRILNDVGDEPGNLPLLEFALSALWEQRDGANLTHNAYEQIGGVEGALARHANEVYGALSLTDQRLARRVFVQMVQPGEGTEDTRRVANREELSADAWSLVQKLADARLVVTNVNAAGVETVEVVHEALIRTWGLLRGWMEEDRAYRAWQERLRQARAQWERSGRDEGALLRGVVLDQAREWAESENVTLSTQEETFIRSSGEARQRREAEEEAQRQRELEQERALSETRRRQVVLVRWAAGLLTVLLIAAVGAAAFAFVQRGEASANAAEAELQATAAFVAQETAVANELVAATRAAEADAARITADSERAEAERQRAAAEEAQAAAEAGQAEALRQQQLALAQSLAALSQSTVQRANDTEVATLLALESYQRNQMNDGNVGWAVDAALRPLVSDPYFNTTLEGHAESVQGVAFSANGRWLATASLDSMVRLWDLENPGTDPLLLEGASGGLFAVATSRDSTLVAAAGESGMIYVWRVEEPDQPPLFLEGHEDDVLALIFVAGDQLVSASLDRSLRLWDPAGSSPGEILIIQDRHVLGLATNAAGNVVALAGDDRTVKLLDLESRDLDTVGTHDSSVIAVAFSPDETRLASASVDSTVRVWDLVEGGEVVIFTGHTSRVRGVVFLADNRRLLSGSDDSTVRVWDIQNPDVPGIVLRGHELRVRTLAVSPDHMLVASGSDDATIRLWQTQTPEGADFIVPAHDGQNILNALFSPDGLLLFTSGADNNIRVWNTANWREGAVLEGHTDRVRGLDYAPERRVLASGGNDGLILLWDVDRLNATPTTLAGHEGPVRSVAFTPDGAQLYSTSEDGRILLWNMENPAAAPEVFADIGEIVYTVNVSPDGALVAASDELGRVFVWQRSDPGMEPLTLTGHTARIRHFIFSNDGSLLVTASSDWSIRVWRTADFSAAPLVFTGHESSVRSVALSDDNRTLVSTGKDNTVRIWNLQDPAEAPAVLEGHRGAVIMARIAPDESYFVTVSDDGTLRVWHFLDDLAPIGCERVRRNLTQDEWAASVGSAPYRSTCEALPPGG